MAKPKRNSITYKKAGVNIDAADAFVKVIKTLKTPKKGAIGSLGGFSGLHAIPSKGMKKPLLVAATDGVGTKLLVARAAGVYDTIGIDLVAMSVNDLVTCGAEPLFFLDYFATGKLDVKTGAQVMKGIAAGCRQADCALLGGETAEMPGMYAKGDFDLAGFCVGIVDQARILRGKNIACGDVLLGIASSGLHSNGFSLVRKAFSANVIRKELSKELLKPTKIYVKPVLRLIKKYSVKAFAHITGGGFYDNIPRVLPENKAVFIKKGAWKIPDIFERIQKKARLSDRQMYRTFNMGIGMVAVIAPHEAVAIKQFLWKQHRLRSWVIGKVIGGKRAVHM